MTYTAENWLAALNEAAGYSYDDIDVEEHVGPIGTAIVEAYGTFENDEEKVTAAIEAAALDSETWDIDYFNKLVRGGVVHYDDYDEALKDYLDENYPGIEVDWLTENCPLRQAFIRDSEIWVETTGTGVYVFNKPS